MPQSSAADARDPDGVEAAFAAAAAALVDDYDVVGLCSRLLRDCARLVGAQAAGLVVQDGRGSPDLLASTSHAAHELELFQLQTAAGPCVDVLRDGAAVDAWSAAEVADRWPTLAEAFASAGFGAVHAVPLHWHGATIGALNVFLAPGTAFERRQQLLARAFADVATIAIAHAEAERTDTITLRTRQALAGRTVIEQAKGVLAFQRGVDTATAFGLLMELADERDELLSVVAANVIAAAVRSPT